MSIFNRKIWIFALLTTIFSACDKGDEKSDEVELPDIVMQVQQQARLYSTEYRLHKIITQDDTRQLQGSILNQKYKLDLPLGKRSIAVPIEATVKTFVDFGEFSEKNVKRNGEKIEIILPDPQFEITSTRVNHDEVKQYIPLLRSNFSDAELTALTQAGRAAVAKDLPRLNLTESARQNAARTLIPLLSAMGFDESQITVTFRKKFTVSEISKFLLDS